MTASRRSSRSNGKSARPGQSDIAKLLGVSVSTVSRALSGSNAINDDVRRRVFDAAQRIGYPTRELAPQRLLERVVTVTSLAGFRDTRSSIYFSLLDGIRGESERLAKGSETIAHTSGEPLPETLDRGLELETGCIFLGLSPAAGTYRALAARGVPVVVANGIDEDLVVDSISPANHAAGRIMARHLMELGHRRLGYLSGVRRKTLQRRLNGFRQFVEVDAGVAGATVCELQLGGDISDTREGEFHRWMEGEGRGVTALCCYNDGAAAWAMERLRALGLGVPGDVSVAGFDDMAIAELTAPALTTFRIDWTEIGRQAVRMLHARMLEPTRAVHFLQVGGELLVRHTTASLAR